MSPVIHIESAADPRLDIFRTLRGRNPATEQGLFVAEGPTVVRRLFDSDYEVHSVMLNDAKWQSMKDECPPGVPRYRVSNEQARELVGYSFHAGVLAAGVRKPSPSLVDICKQNGESFLLVVALRVIDRQNVGTIIRAAAAFGATAVVFGEHSSDPFSRRALRVSMGNGFRMPICEPVDLKKELESVRATLNCQFVATTLDETAIRLPELPLFPRCGFLFGNESHGLDREWLEFCDHRVTIPMAAGTDSLNVGFSAGIILYEQRRSLLLNQDGP